MLPFSAAMMMAGGRTAFSTWNPLDKHADITLSNGNLTAAGVALNRSVRGIKSYSAGKVYAEITCTISGGDGNVGAGLARGAANLADSVGGDTDSIGYNASGNIVRGAFTTAQSTYGTGDVLGIAVNFTSSKVWFSKNGTFVGDPVEGVAGYDISGMGALFLAANPKEGSMTLNVGASTFANTPPSGFLAWG